MRRTIKIPLIWGVVLLIISGICSVIGDGPMAGKMGFGLWLFFITIFTGGAGVVLLAKIAMDYFEDLEDD